MIKIGENMKNFILKNWKKIVFGLIILIILSGVSFFLYIEYRSKFKSVSIELGTDKISVNDFLVDPMYKDNTKIITDLSEIDFSQVSEIDIELSYKGKKEIVKLKIIDTEPPVVEFQDILKYSGYKIDPNDFIVKKEDKSEMIVTASEIEDTSEFKEYVVEVTVSDIYGNKTSKKCILKTTWLKSIVYVELGSEFSKASVVENYDRDQDKISQEEIDKVDSLKVGEYILNATYEKRKYTAKVIVQDTKGPTLELKNLTIYENKTTSKDNFINLVSDVSGEVTTTLITKIDYKKIGTQEIVIEALDKYDNKTTKTAKLTIIKDTKGPVFYGIKDITVNKNTSINYSYGIKAVDANDGTCKFSVSTSQVNLSAAGTYYATYTSKDSKGNLTTAKRKITVRHDQADTNRKFDEFYNQYLAGKSILGMTSTIKSVISYNSSWGGDDPIWYGLTYNSGNCYVHALLLQKALTKAGITNRLIHVFDKTHYWNLVYSGGVWRHYDSTPGSHIVGPATDTEKFNSAAMRGRDWDRSAYPVAN